MTARANDDIKGKTGESEGLLGDKRVAPHKTNGRWFQWVHTDAEQLARSERRMLKSINHKIEQRTVAGLNTIMSVDSSPTGANKRNLVLVHGFAGGVANWLPAWNTLTAHANVYAFDLPGFGRSHRPKVKFGSALDAIDFMCDYLLKWLTELGLVENGQTIDLCGHSFGAYLSANFALRHQDLVDKLVLSDPWGCSKEYERQNLGFLFSWILVIFFWINPLMILRWPRGHHVLPKRRPDFGDMWVDHIEDTMDFYDYTFHCNAQCPPIGEQAFQACCTKAVFAAFPLETIIPAELKAGKVKLGVIFGCYTWMDTEAGEKAVNEFKKNGGTVLNEDVHYIDDAGHQVMSDNAPAYNAVLLDMLGYTGSRNPNVTAGSRRKKMRSSERSQRKS